MAGEIIIDTVEKVEITLREQLQGMIKKLGEYVALSIPILIGGIITTGILPVSDFITWLVSLGILVVSVIVFVLLFKNNQLKKEWEGYLKAMGISRVVETDDLTGRLKNVEECNVKLNGTVNELQIDKDDLRETNLAAFKQLNDLMKRVILMAASGNTADDLLDELQRIKEGIKR